MKLTEEHIAHIEETLVLNGLYFEDLKLEVTDHIASEIEILMEENTLPFEENFKLVLDKWKPQLQPSFSFLIGFANPKIMTTKCHELIKNKLLIVICIASFTTSLVLLLTRNLEFLAFILEIQQVFKTFIFVVFCLVLSIWGLLSLSKRQTSFSYLIKKKSIGLFIFLFMIGIGLFPAQLNHTDFKISFVTIFISIIYVLLAGMYLQLALKHFQFERKLKNN
ncbi:hypothetical protein [Flavobacterium sandaracinum]|uniref:Uncharacterized protein n=1 Tax=Flavobacterium sandaracinum TaxID=2541733 RepID=A0A4R5D226_9FLAO|nr:hypothetical protein [Flavobacterium sandaracinum]TDE04325.1 hypothetical protein E0F91_08390 [Flavobacterium sandaracinum]